MGVIHDDSEGTKISLFVRFELLWLVGLGVLDVKYRVVGAQIGLEFLNGDAFNRDAFVYGEARGNSRSLAHDHVLRLHTKG